MPDTNSRRFWDPFRLRNAPRRGALLWLNIVWVAPIACTPARPDSVWEVLQPLPGAVGVADPADTTALLVMNPSQCTICNSAVSRLKAWRNESPNTRAYRLILTRHPRAEEQSVLARFRMHPDLVLDKPGLTPRGPVVVLVTRGHEISQAVGPRAVKHFVEQPEFLRLPSDSSPDK